MQLIGAGGDEVGEVAEAQLGVAEEGSVGGGGEGAGDLGDEVVGALADGVGEFLGEGLLLGSELRRGHGASLATRAVDFWPSGRSVPLCTKIPPTVETPTLGRPDLVVILDFWHAAGYLGDLARAVHPADEEAAGKLAAEWCRLLKEEGGALTLAALEEWDFGARQSKAVREQRAAVAEYFGKNVHRMEYPE